ncbi:MAG: hypothetical protein KA371_09900 [Acidobacteria bacterium]|jgi:hypothetical protein|nr:hypothetical protein [Acidobacteriota bacterium]
MTRAALALILAFGLASPAAADVTIKQTTSGKGLGMSGTTSGTTYIKGAKMRTDLVTGDTTRSTVFDLDAQKMYSFDSKKKEADVYDLTALQAEMAKGTDLANIKATITPTGQTKSIGGKTATGYDMAISVPATIGGAGEMSMTVNLTGPVWIVKGGPGSADWVNFYKQAATKGFLFGDPRAAKASPGQAKAMVEMYRQMAELGGIAYETQTDIKIEGSGPMAAIMAKMGGVSSSSTVTAVSDGPLADELFAVPAGYKLKERK